MAGIRTRKQKYIIIYITIFLINNIMKIIVYGHARTGTTIAASIVQNNPFLNGINYEPFHPINKKLSDTKFDKKEFKKSLDKLFSEVDIVKAVHDQIPWCNIEMFFKQADKIIFTRRRNLLRASVSLQLAHQTKIWQRPWNNEYYGNNFKPINLNELNRNLHMFNNNTIQIKETLQRIGVNFYELYYEDFFLSGEPQKQLKLLYNFLGIEMPKNPYIKHLNHLMNDHRVNNERTYLKIPNVYEIERKLGSDKFGWLLNGGLQHVLFSLKLL